MGFHGGGWWAYLQHDEKNKSQLSRVLLKRVWAFARPYGRQISLLLLTIGIISGLSLLTPLIIRDLIDNAIPARNVARLNLLALGLVGVPIINGLVGVLQRRLSSVVGEGVIYDLRRALYDHMQRMSLRFFTNTRTGELMSRLNNDVIGAQQAVTSTLLSIVSNVVTVVATLVIMLTMQVSLTLIALLVLPAFILLARRIGGILRQIRRRSLEYSAELNATMNETLNVNGALLVKLFGREEMEMDRFSGHARNVRDVGIQSAVVGRWFMMGLGIATAIGTALIFWLGGRMVLDGTLSLGTVVAFSALLSQLYGPLSSLTNAPVEFAQSMVSFERVFEVLDIPVEIGEAADAAVLTSVAGEITFDGVYFKYTVDDPEQQAEGLAEVVRFGWRSSDAHLRRGKQREEGSEVATRVTGRVWALEDVSFTIEPGQLAALVGPSGAGKTSLTYLIPRLYDTSQGRILIDGHDIREVTLQSLSDNIGMVTQDTFLFYDTIRANLLYARPDATDTEMIAAAQAANIHDFITSLPDQYDTVVGARGYRLSGGERQRVAIARVVLKDPRILVLDEATSSLDSLSERLIQEALGRIMQQRTSLVIAHRLSTILAADVILVVDQGRLVERGTHQTLLARGGLYATLYETQFQSVADGVAVA